jgi:hypothetical protein
MAEAVFAVVMLLAFGMLGVFAWFAYEHIWKSWKAVEQHRALLSYWEAQRKEKENER